jgi:hypothetical protein
MSGTISQAWWAVRLAAGFALGLVATASAEHTAAADEVSVRVALDSITDRDLNRHIATLADDTFEGREAGSRGGRAAGVYLGKELQRLALQGAGDDLGYYQSFDSRSRNVLAYVQGSDPGMAREYIIVSAHYDHVGYGTEQNSYGPIGRIHNGADDNASGTAGLLETIEAVTLLEPAPRRSILFAFWDGEEKGLLGSQHWIDHPTVPLERVRCMINMDMIGRLRGDRVELYGTRTARGARQLFSRANAEGLLLDFTWEMKANSDHHTFYSRGIPAFMLHTGLHDDYHRPSDDAEKVNIEGTRRVARLLFHAVRALADAAELPPFRAASRNESPEEQQRLERPLAALPGRLGVSMRAEEGAAGVRLSHVAAGSAAQQAGLRPGDRIVSFAGQAVSHVAALQVMVLAAEGPQTLSIERAGEAGPRDVTVVPAGTPVRVGLTWRTDDTEPGAVIVTRVVAGSPAEQAGVRPNDRVWSVSGRGFATQGELRDLLTTLPGPLELQIERSGQVSTVSIPLAAAPPGATGG